MPLFFLPSAKPDADNRFIIKGEDARHIALSLRMACGDSLTVSDGEGMHYHATLTHITPTEVTVTVKSAERAESEPPLKITLYQAIPKSDKLETIVQKAVELGATEVVPFLSEFCIKRPHEDKWERQKARLARIAEEAAKQCRRGVIPTIGELLDFREMLNAVRNADLPLFCYEGDNTKPLSACLPDKAPACAAIVVGCEGGFSESEANLARQSGVTLCGLGKRILRCETAPLYALSILSYKYELDRQTV